MASKRDDEAVTVQNLPAQVGVDPVSGLQPLSSDLEPEVLRFVTELRGIFGQLGLSLGQYSRLHYREKSGLSRYLSGSRIPPRAILDELVADITRSLGTPLTVETEDHLRELHLEALACRDARAYQVQVMTDELANAATELHQARLRIKELEGELTRREAVLHDLDAGTRQLRRAWDAQSERNRAELAEALDNYARLEEEHDSLLREAAELRLRLAEAKEREAEALERCRQLEQALNTADPGPAHDNESGISDDIAEPMPPHGSPWTKPALRQRLRDARGEIRRRVRGQDEAIERSLDIVIRSAMGLSGGHNVAQHSKPRGVLFFAGPMGVGKTELAKALTELIFEDERACIRFDMSEYVTEHAVDRLTGAPPGYVGYEAGGELTNALRKRPFSLVLFDEIEKAHPRVLDKILQILDDGRLIDGGGSTTYFSEAVIVFTSNLGSRAMDDRGVKQSRTVGITRGDLEERVTGAIRHQFVDELGRPELLSRIVDKVVVFNFISAEVAAEIFHVQLDRILAMVQRQQGIELAVSEAAYANLRSAATQSAVLDFGGRAIESLLERAFVNPLARQLFEMDTSLGKELIVTGAYCDDGRWEISLEPGAAETVV